MRGTRYLEMGAASAENDKMRTHLPTLTTSQNETIENSVKDRDSVLKVRSCALVLISAD